MPDFNAGNDQRPETLVEGLARLGIQGRPGKPLSLQPGTQTTQCPRCVHTRHGKKTPSLHLKIDGDGRGAVWSCFNAGDCEWNQPQAFRCRGAGRSDGRDGAPPRVYTRPPTDHVRTPHQNALDWFAERGISADTVRACGVQVTEAWMPKADRVIPVLAFPFTRHGVVVNWKYRGANKDFRQEKNAEKVLFGLDDIRGQAEIILVEGEPDKLAFWEAGIKAVASVPDGAQSETMPEDGAAPDPNSASFSYLANCAAELAPADMGGPQRIIIAVDADQPGRVLEYELARRLGLDRCWRLRWPPGIKDANDYLKANGPEALASFLDRAEPWPIRGVVRAGDLLERVRKIYHQGLPPGRMTGWHALDRPAGPQDPPLYSVRLGEITILTGAPGSGKSEWLDNLLLNVTRNPWESWIAPEDQGQPWTFALCSMETPVDRHIIGLAMKALRKPFRTGPTERMTLEDVDAAVAFIHDRFHFIQSEDEAPTMAWVLDRARELVLRFGIKGLGLDPYTELAREPHQMTMGDTQVAQDNLTRFRSFCRVHDIHGWLVAHPAKPGQNSPKVPGLYDISGSAHFANKADYGITVARDRENPAAPVEIHIKKSRFAEVATVGIARLQFHKTWAGYVDPTTSLMPGMAP